VDTRQTVLEVVAEITGMEVSELQPQMELVADLGLDSAKSVQMLVTLEERVDVEIDEQRIPKLETIGDVVAALDEVVA